MKWSNTLKQFVGKLPTDIMSVSDHFVELPLKGLIFSRISQEILQAQINPFLANVSILDPLKTTECQRALQGGRDKTRTLTKYGLIGSVIP